MDAVASICCGIACALLVYAEYRKHARLRVAAKLVASALFVGIALPAWGGGAFERWLVAGLVLGAIGDAALLGRSTRAFLGGLVAFLLGHLAYVGALACVLAPAGWPAAAGWAVVLPIGGGLAVLIALWRRLGSLRVPVIVYVAAIVAMVIGALAVYRAGALAEPRATWVAAGAVLFFISDFAVARDRFVERAFANKLWGLPAYYAAQLLLAHAAIAG